MNNFVCKFKNKCKKIGGFFVFNPHKHWNVFLYFFVIITFLFIIFSFYLFFKIHNSQVYENISVQLTQKNILKEKLLKQVIDSFNQKAEKYSTILKSQ